MSRGRVIRPVALVADDDPAFRETLALALENVGFQVRQVRDGMELLVGFVERWEPTPDPEAVHWVERVELGEDAVVREPTDYEYWSLVIDMSPMFPVDSTGPTAPASCTRGGLVASAAPAACPQWATPLELNARSPALLWVHRSCI